MLALITGAPRADFLDQSLTRLPPSAAPGYAFASGDLTGDGSRDLFEAAGSASRLLINDGAGNFADESASRLPASTGRFTAALLLDVDGDGDLDLVLADADGANALWRNDGSGTFSDDSPAAMPAAGGTSMALAAADIDGDGDLDLVVAVHDGADRALVNDGTGRFSDQSEQRLPGAVSASTATAFADVDGDGSVDLLLSGFTGPVLYLNDGLGQFSPAPAALPADVGPATGAAFVDVDGDGHVDLLLAAGATGVRVLRNDGGGVFSDQTPARMPAPAGFAIKVAAADLTEDGRADVIATFADGVRVFANDGSGVFSDVSALLAPDPAQRRAFGVLAVDVDLDLDLDLLIASGAGGDRLLVNDTPLPRVRVTTAPAYVQTGDSVTITVDAFDEDLPLTLDVSVEDPLAGVTPLTLAGGSADFVPVQAGVHTVVVTATDGAANAVTRRLDFTVVDPDLTPPAVSVLVSPPDPLVGQQVTLTLSASDANGIQSRTLEVDGMPVPVNSAGIAHYVPSVADLGPPLAVRARASDPAGNEGVALAQITVQQDVIPPLVTLDVSPANPALLSPVAINATATDNVAVSQLQVVIAAPSGAQIPLLLDPAGNASFVPSEPGVHQVSATALDPSGLSGNQVAVFDAFGVPDVTPPQVSVSVFPASVATGQSTTFTVSASDDVGVSELTLALNGQPLPLAPDGTAVFTPLIAGSYTAIARALDAFGNEASAQSELQVLDPASDTEAPQVSITAPAPGTEVAGLVPITGTATDATLTGYQLAIAPIGSASFTTFATGSTPVVGGVLGTLDTDTLAEGFYQVRLSASDVNGASASTSVSVLYVDNVRLGRFTLEYQDVRLAAFGLPLAVQRFYDSAADAPGDFGRGWKLRLLDVELRIDAAANVFITLPGGKRTAFAFTPVGVPLFPIYTSRYTPPADVHATLTAPGCEALVRSGGQWFCGLGDPFPPSTYELTLKDGTRYTIVNGEVTRLEDRNGNFLTLGADGIIASSGRSVVFQRDGAGRIVRAIDPNLGEFNYFYDGQGRLERTEGQAGHATRYVYQGTSALIQDIQSAHSTAALGLPGSCQALGNEYYPDGRIAAREDAAGNRTTYTYDPAARSETVTDPAGNATTYVYDALGRVLEVYDALGSVTRYTYDTQGNETSLTRPSGSVVSYTYDGNGNRLSETHMPEPGVTLTSTSQYNALGLLTRFTAPSGERTEYQYDADGNRTRRERFDRFGAPLEVDVYTYDANGNRSTWTNARGEVTTYQYLPTGELISQSDAAGVTTSYEYDANGNRTAFIDGEGNRAEFEFNALNDPTLMRQGGVVRYSIGYDPLGNMTSLTDAHGNTTSYAYDCADNLVSVAGPHAESAAYEYDGVTNLTRITDPRGKLTTFDYDQALRPTGRTGPDGEVWGVEYNPDGIIDEYVSPEAAAAVAPILHTYDGMQRLLVRNEPERDIQYLYDDSNRLLQVSEDDGSGALSTQFAYDDLGNLLLIDAPGGAINYSYAAGGQRATMSTPDGIVTHYAYDDGGRIASMTSVDGAVSDAVSFSYDLAGRRTLAQYSNGASTQYSYDGLGRISGVSIRDGGGTVIARFDYTLDGNGNRTAVTLVDGAATYSYDGLSRLIGEDVNTTSAAVTSRSWSYDAAGNRLDPGASHGDDNRLLSDAGGAYGYDLNGNRTTHGGATYSYDSVNRLIGYAAAGTSAAYRYDYLGRRVLRTVNGVTSEYLYDGQNIAAEIGAGGMVSKRYTHGASADEIHLARVAGQSFFYHTDALGSVVAITDASGTLVKRYAYDAWGDTLVDDGVLPYDNRLRFVGREFDAESGLYHVRARAYDPASGRFLQKDPLQGVLRVPQSLNLYAYARNNPLNFIDPSGRLVAVEYGFLLTFPNGREAAAALAGFLHGFGSTGLVFIGEFLAVSGNSNTRDIQAMWDEALARTRIRMDEIKNMLGVAEQASDLAGVAGIPGAFKSGVSFKVGFEIKLGISAGPFSEDLASGGVTFEASGGGFENGVTQGLEYLMQLRPR